MCGVALIGKQATVWLPLSFSSVKLLRKILEYVRITIKLLR
jgi:hypothetical protein